MSAAEIAGWERHFRTCPPGDWRTQHLLAETISTLDRLTSAMCGGKLKVRSPLEIAPWLKSPELDYQLRLRKITQARKRTLQIVRSKDDA